MMLKFLSAPLTRRDWLDACLILVGCVGAVDHHEREQAFYAEAITSVIKRAYEAGRSSAINERPRVMPVPPLPWCPR